MNKEISNETKYYSYKEFKNEISIIEIAQKIGYSDSTKWAKKKSSMNYPCLENANGDRIYIKNPKENNKMIYGNINNNSDYGDLINFINNRLETDFIFFRNKTENAIKAINDVLYDYLNINPVSKKKYQILNTLKEIQSKSYTQKEFDETLFNIKPLENQNWINSRKINKETLNHQYFKNTVFNVKNPLFKDGKFIEHAKFNNTGFPYKESLFGKLVGIEERNFNFKGHGINSKKISGVWFSNPPKKIDKAFLTESALDALSHFQLNKPVNAIYFSIGGNLTEEQNNTINNILNETKALHKDSKICCAFDNDLNGSIYDLKVINQLAVKKRLFSVKQLIQKETIKLSLENSNPDTLINFLNRLMQKLSNNKQTLQNYKFNIKQDFLEIEIPKNYLHLNEFNKYYIQTTQLDKIIQLDKAEEKDWNQQLLKNT